MQYRDLTNDELITRLRTCASIWFKNDDLLLLEEMIRRLQFYDQKEKRSYQGD